jgi:hypothetical protein
VVVFTGGLVVVVVVAAAVVVVVVAMAVVGRGARVGTRSSNTSLKQRAFVLVTPEAVVVGWRCCSHTHTFFWRSTRTHIPQKHRHMWLVALYVSRSLVDVSNPPVYWWGGFLPVLREDVPISAYSQGRGAERGLKICSVLFSWDGTPTE